MSFVVAFLRSVLLRSIKLQAVTVENIVAAVKARRNKPFFIAMQVAKGVHFILLFYNYLNSQCIFLNGAAKAETAIAPVV
jgi:hypothetical protein